MATLKLRFLALYFGAMTLFTSPLWSKAQALEASPPIGLEELKSLLRSSGTFEEVPKAIGERGVSFAPTEGIITQLKEEIIRNSQQYASDFSRLGTALQQHRPKELVVGIARFTGGQSIDIEELSTATKDYLDAMRESNRLLRIEPISLKNEIRSDDSAFEAGNNAGVDIVVWGDWRRLQDGKVLFHPRIRVITTRSAVGITKGDIHKRDYTLDSFSQAAGFSLTESAATKTSNLVGILVALSFYNQGDYAKAAEILKPLPARDSEIYFYLGNCSYYLQRYDEAVGFFQNAVSRDRQALKPIHNLGTVQLALGNLPEAISNFQSALRIDPNSDKTLNNLGVALIKIDQEHFQEDYKRGFSYFEKAKTINPENATAWYNYGAALFNLGGGSTQQDGLAAFLEYLKRRPGDHATWVLCVQYWKGTSAPPEQTYALISRAIDGDPRMTEYFDRLVDILYEPSTYGEQDIRLSRKMLELIPKSADVKSQKNLRARLLARIVRSEVELGHTAQAQQSFSEIGIQETDFKDCADRLAYKLASGSIPSISLTEPLLIKTFYATTYENFFRRVYGLSDFFMSPKDVLDVYKAILKSQSTHAAALIGDGVIHIEVLRLPERAWRTYGFLAEDEDVAQWANRFRKEGKLALRRAMSQLSDPRTKRDLVRCIGELDDLPSNW